MSPRSRRSRKKDGSDYVINGSKMWITNAAQADWLCLLVNTGEGPVHANKTLVIVPTKTKGVTIGAKIDKLGMRASDTCPVFFEDVRVPQRNRIGEEGMGFMMQMVQFQEERLCAAIGALRGMETLIDADDRVLQGTPDVRPAADRQPGDPLPHGGAAHRGRGAALADLPRRRGIHRRQRCHDARVDGQAQGAAGSCARSTDACLQYWGGMGFTWDNPASRAYRDTRLLSIGGGADEIMLGIICKLMGILPGKKKKSSQP